MGVRTDLFRRDPSTVPVTDFFGSLRPVELTNSIVNIMFKEPNTSTLLETEGKFKYVPQFPVLSQILSNS